MVTSRYDDERNEKNDETERETLENLFREVFDLVDDRVAKITDIEVDLELRRVLEPARSVGVDDPKDSREPDSIEVVGPLHLRPWDGTPAVPTELPPAETTPHQLVEVEADDLTARRAAKHAENQPSRTTIRAVKSATSKSSSAKSARAFVGQLPRRPTRRFRSARKLMDKAPKAAAAAAIAVVLLGLFTFGLGLVKKDNLAAAGGDVVLQVVYSAPTANDAQITLPERVKADLENVGLQHNKIALKRVDSNGKVSTSIHDLTPRAGDSSSGRVLTSDKQAIPAIDAKIAEIEKEINSSVASTGNRALYTGLRQINFGSEPTIIISSGIDLTSPVDFRELKWNVPAEDVVAEVRNGGSEPAFHGPVTFLFIPTAGTQDQLGQAENEYRSELWVRLLLSAGATSVTIGDAIGTSAAPLGPSTPAVAVPESPVWDKLAECQSGKNWSANTGNGYYGGLQFSLSTWRAYGGSGMPHEATREEQIRIAKKLQADQGWGAWPACSAKLGLR